MKFLIYKALISNFIAQNYGEICIAIFTHQILDNFRQLFAFMDNLIL